MAGDGVRTSTAGPLRVAVSRTLSPELSMNRTPVLADRNHHLQQALQTNRRIGMAIGILMALHQLDERHAFDTLRIAFQHTHRKLRDIAEEVILTGAIPQWRHRPPI